MERSWRIGTRESKLALWQTHQVVSALKKTGEFCEIVPQKSEGDLRLDLPLYELGISGIFTRSLDISLLEGSIDLAVHSLKDVPTQLAKGLCLAAVLPRGAVSDILVLKSPDTKITKEISATIATGSLRRRAQWLHRYPAHQLENLRGNVQTRLKKLETRPWQGAIFAEAGLARMDLLAQLSWTRLDWMLPAPAQGIVGIVCREEDEDCRNMLAQINHHQTFVAASLERSFMRELEGGCTAPIGALARVGENSYSLKGTVLSLDGKQRIDQFWTAEQDDPEKHGVAWARELLEQGAREILREIRKKEQENKQSSQSSNL